MSAGDDQKSITSIAREYYGGYPAMFEALGWDWQGSNSMNRAAVFAKEQFGSVQAFEQFHRDKPPKISLIDAYSDRPILLTSMRSWEPKLRGGWNIHGKPSREAAIEKTKAPFILVCYIIRSPDAEAIDHADKVIGFLEVTHEKVTRYDLDSPEARHSSGQAEAYSLRATRAFEFVSSSRPDILEIVPDLRTAYPDMIRDLNKGILLNKDHLSILSRIPYKEVPLYGSENNFKNSVFIPSVRGGDVGVEQELSSPFAKSPSVWIKAFYGYDPESWGCVGYNQPGRIDTLINNTTDPFIMAIWVTFDSNDPAAGKLAGFMEVTHEKGRRADFIAPFQDDAHEKGKWEYSLRASRAWEILPEFQPKIRDFYPDMQAGKRERASGRWAEKLPDQYIEKLKALPRREVKVYGSDAEITPDIVFPSTKGGFVKSGPGRRNGFEVGEPRSLEKELYILKLNGDVDAFLGRNGHGQSIYKIGLSISPETRKATLNSAIPNGQFYWSVERTTLRDGDPRYPNHEIAEAGEMAMKEYLGGIKNAHLGGEFYLASEKAIKAAWELGKSKASAMKEE